MINTKCRVYYTTQRHRNAKLVVHNYSNIIMSKVVHEHSVKGVFYLLDSIVLHIMIFISLLVTLKVLCLFCTESLTTLRAAIPLNSSGWK